MSVNAKFLSFVAHICCSNFIPIVRSERMIYGRSLMDMIWCKMLAWTMAPLCIQNKGQWMLLVDYWRQGQILMGIYHSIFNSEILRFNECCRTSGWMFSNHFILCFFSFYFRIKELKCPDSLAEHYKPVACCIHQWLSEHAL